MSLRYLSRAVPRALPRSKTTLSRFASRFPCLQTNLRPTPISSQFAFPRFTAAFSTTVRQRQANEELLMKLGSEIAVEESARESDSYSSNIRDYLENSPFQMHDKAGKEEVVLTRKYNDEDVRVVFSIADLTNYESDHLDNEFDDPALYDEDAEMMESQSGGANTKGSIKHGQGKDGNIRVSPEDSVSATDAPELENEDYGEDEQEASFPINASITITRPGKGALGIEAQARDGEFVINAVHYFPSADLAEPETAEKEWARRDIYTGPNYDTLDEDLQLLLEKYLEERGVNTRMALFIPDYIDSKEQKEYLGWLNNIKDFLA